MQRPVRRRTADVVIAVGALAPAGLVASSIGLADLPRFSLFSPWFVPLVLIAHLFLGP